MGRKAFGVSSSFSVIETEARLAPSRDKNETKPKRDRQKSVEAHNAPQYTTQIHNRQTHTEKKSKNKCFLALFCFPQTLRAGDPNIFCRCLGAAWTHTCSDARIRARAQPHTHTSTHPHTLTHTHIHTQQQKTHTHTHTHVVRCSVCVRFHKTKDQVTTVITAPQRTGVRVRSHHFVQNTRTWIGQTTTTTTKQRPADQQVITTPKGRGCELGRTTSCRTHAPMLVTQQQQQKTAHTHNTYQPLLHKTKHNKNTNTQESTNTPQIHKHCWF
jgi:hypothetical protein